MNSPSTKLDPRVRELIRESLEAIRSRFKLEIVDQARELKLLEGSNFQKRFHELLFRGGFKDCSAARPMLSEDTVKFQNQDFSLPRLEAALKGCERSRAHYEQHRIFVPENLADWSVPLWKKHFASSTRKLDVSSKELRRWVNRVTGKRSKPLTSLALSFPSTDLSYYGGELVTPEGEAAERHSVISFTSGVEFLAECQKSAEQIRGKRVQLKILSAEVCVGFRSLRSPTPVGQFYRSVIRREIDYLLAFAMIDDAAVVFDLPLSDAAKTNFWKTVRKAPWGSARTIFSEQLRAAVVDMRSKGTSEEEIAGWLEEYSGDPLELSRYVGEMREKEKSALSDESIALKSVPKSPSLVQSTDRSSRLYFIAALNAAYGAAVDAPRTARVLAKLTANDVQARDEALAAIEQQEDIDTIVSELRSQRVKDRNSSVETSSQPESLTMSRQLEQQLLANEAESVTPEIVYARRALKDLSDGRVRHLIEQGFEELAETPQSADVRKVQETTDVWELRLLAQNLRAYFVYAGKHRYLVLRAGSKEDQKRHLEKLQQLRDKEVAMLEQRDAGEQC